MSPPVSFLLHQHFLSRRTSTATARFFLISLMQSPLFAEPLSGRKTGCFAAIVPRPGPTDKKNGGGSPDGDPPGRADADASQSYRSASMGFSTAAFLAGRYPKAMPMPAETPKATRIAAMLGLTVMGCPV